MKAAITLLLALALLAPPSLVSACSGRLNYSTGNFECLGTCGGSGCIQVTKKDAATGLIYAEYCTCNPDLSAPSTCYLNHYQTSGGVHLWSCIGDCASDLLCNEDMDSPTNTVTCNCL